MNDNHHHVNEQTFSLEDYLEKLTDMENPGAEGSDMWTDLVSNGYQTDQARGGIVGDKSPISPSNIQTSLSGIHQELKVEDAIDPVNVLEEPGMSRISSTERAYPTPPPPTKRPRHENLEVPKNNKKPEFQKPDAASTYNWTTQEINPDITQMNQTVKEKLADCVKDKKLPQKTQAKRQEEAQETDDDMRAKKKENNRRYAKESRVRKTQKLEMLEQENKEKEAIIEIYKKCLTLYHTALRSSDPEWEMKVMEWYPGQATRNQEPMKIACLLPVDPLIPKGLGNSPYGSIRVQSVDDRNSQEEKDVKPVLLNGQSHDSANPLSRNPISGPSTGTASIENRVKQEPLREMDIEDRKERIILQNHSQQIPISFDTKEKNVSDSSSLVTGMKIIDPMSALQYGHTSSEVRSENVEGIGKYQHFEQQNTFEGESSNPLPYTQVQPSVPNNGLPLSIPAGIVPTDSHSSNHVNLVYMNPLVAPKSNVQALNGNHFQSNAVITGDLNFEPNLSDRGDQSNLPSVDSVSAFVDADELEPTFT